MHVFGDGQILEKGKNGKGINGTKTNDAYNVRLYALAFTNRCLEPLKVKSYAQTAHSKKIRKKMHETMYETVAEPAMHVIVQAGLLLYASELFRGIVMHEKGNGVSHTVPIYESYSLPDMLLCLDLVGHYLTEHHQFYCQSIEAENSKVKLVDHPNIIKLDYETQGALRWRRAL